MKISNAGLKLIKQYEGFWGAPYFCPAGKLTIGYGHVILSGENFSDAITEENAEILLKQDVSSAENTLNRLVIIELSQNQFDALVSFVYNVGSKAFEKSTLLRFLNENKLELAAEQFSRWIFAKGVVQKGLINRRVAEKLMFLEL